MQKKNIIIGTLCALFILAFVSVVSADWTVTVRLGDGGTIGIGVENINTSVVYTGGAGGTNLTNMTFSYRETGASSWTTIGNNASYNLTLYTFGWDTSSLKDDTTYELQAVASNYSSVTLATDTETALDIDNTNPICSQSTLSSNTMYNPQVTKTVTVTATNSTSCSVNFDANYYAFTESSDSCTFNMYSNKIPNGVYDVTFKTLDEYDSTTCTLVDNVNIRWGAPPTNLALQQVSPGTQIATSVQSVLGEPPKQTNNNAFLVGAIIAVVLIWLVSKKK